MEERLLLNGVSTDRGNVAIFQSIKLPINIFPGRTKTRFSFRDKAAPFTGMAPDFVALAFIKPGLSNTVFNHIELTHYLFDSTPSSL